MSGTNALTAGLLVPRGFELEDSREGASGVASRFPHAPQNRAPADTVAPQRGHFTSSGIPHCSQNLAAEGLSNLHDEHVIGLPNLPHKTYRPKYPNHSA